MRLEVHIDGSVPEVKVDITAPAMSREVSDLIRRMESGGSALSGMRNKRYYPLNLTKVYAVTTQGNRILAHTLAGEYEVKGRMYELEERLAPEGFIRISQSALANVSHIQNFAMHFNGTMELRFKNGAVEYVSRRYVPAIKKYFRL
ncbi:LytTR family DNA-binding domain-containing protein [Gehongia tenuis]|uniref:LytTR family transcriptional regulator n=1 Tax=Gehongia tenuis TaxID=2763655 RepID=A0A926D5Y7_9FIRM|nr:LytTR family DNA-binding domain-containing protein [Gehongia tenuis]MBC8531851.1 LytTR family transcriptional regulator [Gehongia tenuis]